MFCFQRSTYSREFTLSTLQALMTMKGMQTGRPHLLVSRLRCFHGHDRVHHDHGFRERGLRHGHHVHCVVGGCQQIDRQFQC